MLVQALAEYADTRLKQQLEQDSWEEKPVPYLIAITEDGEFVSIVPRMMEVARGKKAVQVARSLLVPRSPVPRNSGLHPLLAADDIKYVLGAGPWTSPGQEQNNQERHNAFVRLIEKAAAETEDPALIACARFFARSDQVEAARKALGKAKAGDTVALSVSGNTVADFPGAAEYWSKHYRDAVTERVSGLKGECLISGRIGPIAPTHDKIKHLAGLGGQSSGVALMSFDKDAFRSYGWEQNANSPVAPDRAMAYVLALNHLLRPGSRNRRDLAGVAFVYWTKREADLELMDSLENPDPDQISRLLQLDQEADPDPNMFYMAGFGANGARLLVRYWVFDTLANVKTNHAAWFTALRVTPIALDTPPFPKFWQLLRAIDKDAEPPKAQAVALIRRALEGPLQLLGHDILSAALTRLRAADNRLDPARAGLIRLCVNDLTKGERPMSENLDEGQTERAYLCGRLLAAFENLQYATYRSADEGQVNLTVADRYFSLASTYPAIAFPKLEQLGKKHFQKLGRLAPNVRTAIEKEIATLHVAIGPEFPNMLSLENQGRFALGYYHQRANQFQQARERKEAKREAELPPDKENESE